MQLTAIAPGDTTVSQRAQRFESLAAQARDGDLSVAALIGAIDAFRTSPRGGESEAEALFRVWLQYNSLHSLSYVIRYNFAVLLSESGALAEARDQLQLTLLDNPEFAPAAINLGSVLERLGDRAGAVETWRTLINRLGAVHGDAASHRVTALNQMARVLENAAILSPAEAALRMSIDLDPAQREVIQHLVALRQSQCSWPVLAPTARLQPAGLLAGSSPLALAALIDDPILQLANAHRYHLSDARPSGPCTVGRWPPPELAHQRKLRIGYVSSDLRSHAVGFLTAGLFELHDRARVEVHAYYCGISNDDALKARFQASTDFWTDIREMSDRAAAAAIVADGIDILVDLNGYTKDGRIKLFAYRPAPCIVNWLGYPGTTGSPHHHYIIADEQIIPVQDEIFYSEKVLRLACYQPNDRKRVVADSTPARAELGLPNAGFVFCVFNGPQKITPELFAIWMSILRDVPGSVLWMLSVDDAVSETLRDHARDAGMDAERLVFAGRMPNPQHLARYRHADLFLDTAPYGAHTTASDALWMGVPVLTVAGRGFAARVCASLVHAAGVPELVCADWDAYRATAIALGRDPARRDALAAKLHARRDHSVLFDTPGLVRRLEDLYDSMWQDHCRDEMPVPRLVHPAYHDIGNDPRRPALPDRAELLAWWDRNLAYRNAVCALPADRVLWPEHRAAS
jgi:predicted O-linked N-acetylglucosamine transferase (SPINDLY family)